MMVTSTYVRMYVPVPVSMYVCIITTFPGSYNSLSFKYGTNTRGVGGGPGGLMKRRQEPHISDTGYRRSPQQVAKNQNLVDFCLV
jgi:hypothetical protein